MIEMTWKDIEEACKEIANWLQGRKIYGIPRSGTIVAGCLSFHGCELSPVPTLGVVIVDDIADTGYTLQKYAEWETAALFVRKGCSPQPTYFARIIKEDDYVLMPWENKERIKERLGNGCQFFRGV